MGLYNKPIGLRLFVSSGLNICIGYMYWVLCGFRFRIREFCLESLVVRLYREFYERETRETEEERARERRKIESERLVLIV